MLFEELQDDYVGIEIVTFEPKVSYTETVSLNLHKLVKQNQEIN